MSDGTTLNGVTQAGGDKIWTEDTGSSNGKIPRGKIALGAADVDGGDVTASNPLPTQPSQGGAVTSATNGAPTAIVDNAGNVLGVSSHPVRIDPTGTTPQPVTGAVTVSGTATVAQGPAASLSGAWTVEVTDGTHTMPTGDVATRAIQVTPGDGTRVATFKAASTAAQATDTAEVVALSPNSPLPYPARTYGPHLQTESVAIKASAGSLFSLRVTNRNASPIYLLVYNLTTPPVDGSVTPLDAFLVPGNTSDRVVGTDFFTESGISFSTGISMVASTTGPGSGTITQTTAAANSCDITAVYS